MHLVQLKVVIIHKQEKTKKNMLWKLKMLKMFVVLSIKRLLAERVIVFTRYILFISHQCLSI